MTSTRLIGLVALLAALAFTLAGCSGGKDEQAAAGGGGQAVSLEEILAGEVHPHSLMVDREDSERLWLGVHGGLYVSRDAGRSWRLAGLEGADAMNLADTAEGPFWVAGHDVLQRSRDSGRSFEPVRPEGLPNLDLHGFTVRAGRPREIIAAAAGEGLYISRDGGESFAPLSEEVGASVFGMSMTEEGTLYASDPQRGLLVSRNAGESFDLAVEAPGLVAAAAHPERSELVLTGGEPGIAVSHDGGRSFEQTFSEAPVAALALDPSDPERAFALGADAVLYASTDAGRSWSPVTPATTSAR